MALSNIEKHYNKHPEDKRLLRRHGIVEFQTTMHHLHRFLKPGNSLNKKYDPEGDDRYTERVVRMVEAGLI